MVTVILNPNGFHISTYQENGWIRQNIYEYIDNEWVNSETFKGRWK